MYVSWALLEVLLLTAALFELRKDLCGVLEPVPTQ